MKRILLLEGGFNEEHEISLKTSLEVQKSLRKMKLNFDVITVDPKNFADKIKNVQKDYICFNALHGPFGEDGSIQKILENNKLLYTHSNSKASEIAFNKKLTKIELKNTIIPLVDSDVITRSQITKNLFIKFFKRFNSFVMKPVSSGSSFGVKIFKSIKDIEEFFLNYKIEIQIYKNHDEIMIEKYIGGRELTVGVIENENVSTAMGVTEIISENKFYDYDAKYIKGLSKHILPANIPIKINERCLEFAKIAHDKVGCKGLSRSDFIYDQNNIFFLEINTQPGLTLTSLIPEQLIYKNINFNILIKNIIEASE